MSADHKPINQDFLPCQPSSVGEYHRPHDAGKRPLRTTSGPEVFLGVS
jgi:hypothetical protein